jgi:CheY-like chemotaxis protein
MSLISVPGVGRQIGFVTMKRVLLVGDDEAGSALIKSAFERFSMDVRLEHVKSAVLAWELIGCWSDAPAGRRPVCILIDLPRSSHDGLWLLEKMRADQRFSALPVMAFSRDPEMTASLREYSNVAGVFVRPIDEVEWRRLIQTVARLSQALPDLAGA